MKYCSECGKEIGTDAIFCSNCGSKINKDIDNKTTDNSEKDKSIKADLKIEVTNATTEKAFKKVGEAVDETISSSKQVVKATTGYAKRLFIPAIILLVFAGIAGAIYIKAEKQRRAESDAKWERERQQIGEQRREQMLREEQSCVIQEFKRNNHEYTGNLIVYNPSEAELWDSIKTYCDLTYTEVEYYQKKLGMRLEKLKIKLEKAKAPKYVSLPSSAPARNKYNFCNEHNFKADIIREACKNFSEKEMIIFYGCTRAFIDGSVSDDEIATRCADDATR